MTPHSYWTSTQCQHQVKLHGMGHRYMSSYGTMPCAVQPVLHTLLYNIVMHYLCNHIRPMTSTNILLIY